VSVSSQPPVAGRGLAPVLPKAQRPAVESGASTTATAEDKARLAQALRLYNSLGPRRGRPPLKAYIDTNPENRRNAHANYEDHARVAYVSPEVVKGSVSQILAVLAHEDGHERAGRRFQWRTPFFRKELMGQYGNQTGARAAELQYANVSRLEERFADRNMAKRVARGHKKDPSITLYDGLRWFRSWAQAADRWNPTWTHPDYLGRVRAAKKAYRQELGRTPPAR